VYLLDLHLQPQEQAVEVKVVIMPQELQALVCLVVMAALV
jgi:hypothetical protein